MSNRIRAFYSVVQYVPDAGRAEGANVGVLLYVPSLHWLELKPSDTLARARKFFRPNRDEIDFIKSGIASLRSRMHIARTEFESEKDLVNFIGASADEVRLTAPRLAMIQEPEQDLCELFQELVGDAEMQDGEALVPISKKAGILVPAPIATVFQRLVKTGVVWRPGKIEVPTVRRKLEIPYAFKNGVVNLVRPESLVMSPGRLEDQLAKLGFQGRLLHEHPDDGEERKLVVLSSNPNASKEAEQQYESTLGDFDVDFVPYRKASEFAKKVERTAHA